MLEVPTKCDGCLVRIMAERSRMFGGDSEFNQISVQALKRNSWCGVANAIVEGTQRNNIPRGLICVSKEGVQSFDANYSNGRVNINYSGENSTQILTPAQLNQPSHPIRILRVPEQRERD